MSCLKSQKFLLMTQHGILIPLANIHPRTTDFHLPSRSEKVAPIKVLFSGTLIFLSADVLAGSSQTFQRTMWTLETNLGWCKAPKRCRILWRFLFSARFAVAVETADTSQIRHVDGLDQ